MAQRFDDPTGAGGEPEVAAMAYDPSRSDSVTTPEQTPLVLQRHQERLMSIEGVEGVGLTRDEIGNDALVVYLRDQSVRARIPKEVEGYPVETVVTGPIDAYTADA